MPVWDSTRGTGRKVAYHVSGFADVQITSYRLHHDNKISAKYLGPSTCATPRTVRSRSRPAAPPPRTSRSTITLTGTSRGRVRPDLPRRRRPVRRRRRLVGRTACVSTLVKATVTCTVTASYTPAADFYGQRRVHVHGVRRPSESGRRPCRSPSPRSTTAGSGRRQRRMQAPSRWCSTRRRCWPTTRRDPPTRPARTLTVTAVTAGADTHGTVTLTGGTCHLHARARVRRARRRSPTRCATTGRPPASPIRCVPTAS